MAAAPQGSPIVMFRILWAALLFSQIVCLGLLVVPGLVERPAEPPDPSQVLLCAVLGAGLLFASFVLGPLFRKSAFARAKSALSDRGPSALDRDDVARVFADPEAARREAFALGFTPFILVAVFSTGIADLGLVLGALGHPITVYAPFFAVGMIATAARFPTDAGFLVPLARARGASMG